MSSRLWTPQGMVNTEKGIEEVSREEIIILSKMHEVAQNRRISVVCKDCNSAFTGQNNDDPNIAFLQVGCQCRLLRHTRGS